MPPPDSDARSEATLLLQRLAAGEQTAQARLLDLLYDDLRGVAAGLMRAERGDHTWQPTALVHEAWMRLAREDRSRWEARGHFLAVAAVAMRRLLVNHARDARALKRGGGAQREALTGLVAAVESDTRVELLALEDALEQLEVENRELAQLVELRFYGGLSADEAAQAMNLAPRTAERRWVLARAWLHRRLATADER